MDPVVAGSYAVIVVALLGFPILAGWLVYRLTRKTAEEVEGRHAAERKLDAATIASLKVEIESLKKDKDRASEVAQDQLDAADRIDSVPDADLWGSVLQARAGGSTSTGGNPS